MKILKNYSPHSVTLIALAVLGEAIISVPYKPSDIYSFSAFLLSFLIAIPLFLFAPCILKKSVKLLKSNYTAVKLLFRFLFSAVALLLFLSAAFPFLEFSKFSSAVLLPKTPKIISLLLFLLVLLPFLTAKKEPIFKLSLLSLAFIGLIIILLFALSVPSMKLINISVFAFPPIKRLTGEGVNYFIKIFVPALSAIILCYEVNPSLNKKTAFLGLSLGGLLLGGVFITSMLILGGGANHFEFPYLSSIGTLTFGNLFTRLDFFVYYLFFVTSLIKTAICIKSGIFITGLLKKQIIPLTARG